MKTVILLTALALGAAPLAAQDLAATRNTRQGFWIGFGLGAGSAGLDCNGCDDDRESSVSGNFRLGGTVSSHVLLGGELAGWGKKIAGTDNTLGFGMFTATFYPSARGAFWLKAGIGGMSFMSDDGTDELEAKAGAGLFGLGYDFRVSRNMSVTPYLNAFASGEVTAKVNGAQVPVNGDIKVNLVQFGVGLTWH